MKSISLFIAFIALSTISLAQKGTYIAYEMSMEANDPQMEMMISMMEGSTMEIAISEERSYVKTNMGALSTTEIDVDLESKIMTMYMTGMMGSMAFSGHIDSLDQEETDEIDVDLKLVKNETKKILGYKCKKAIITDEEGNESTYWYTEEIERPEGVSQMPNTIPGLCLEMTIINEMMNMTYTATDIKESTDLSTYKVEVPEDVDIQSFEDLENMSGGF